MKKIKMGIFGIHRGANFYDNILVNNAEVVAVCDAMESRLEEAKEHLGKDLATYTNFDDFLNHEGLEAIFLCNYFHEHASYAIRALEKNIHVLSECVSNATMAEGVALMRAVQKSKAIYMLAENYPFSTTNQEMRRLYRSGILGKILYAEGEYNHPEDPDNPITVETLRPYLNHWRNYLPRTYYVTHALAPLIYITGGMPVRITAMPVYSPETRDGLKGLYVGDQAAIITCLNDNNSVYRVGGHSGFGAHNTSVRICCEDGQAERIRGTEDLLLRYNYWNVPENAVESQTYTPQFHDDQKELIEKAGHGGGDFYVIREFLNCIRENKQPEFDAHFAVTMASVGILGHRSALELGVPYDIPDLRKEEEQKKYENDYLTPFWGSDGSAPTIRATSHEEFQVTEAAMEEYLDLIRRAKSESES